MPDKYRVIKVDPCAGCEKDCATCHFKNFDTTDYRFEFPYCEDDYYDVYSRFANLFIKVGHLCEQCLQVQMRTREEVIRHCENDDCPYHWASFIYVSDVQVTTEPSFQVDIIDCYYRFPSYQTLRKMKGGYPAKWSDILGLSPEYC